MFVLDLCVRVDGYEVQWTLSTESRITKYSMAMMSFECKYYAMHNCVVSLLPFLIPYR